MLRALRPISVAKGNHASRGEIPERESKPAEKLAE